eukprot:scaffold52988_cov68-Phaeocystis_antarctica.AAC.13
MAPCVRGRREGSLAIEHPRPPPTAYRFMVRGGHFPSSSLNGRARGGHRSAPSSTGVHVDHPDRAAMAR